MRRRNRIISLILTILMVACGPSPSKRLEANKELVHRFTASINASDWDALDELLTEDFQCIWRIAKPFDLKHQHHLMLAYYRRHSQATPFSAVNSREEFKQLQESFLVSIPDQHITIGELIAEGDKVAGYGTYSGTQIGPMGEFPTTGKSLEGKFLAIFRIEDSRIAELLIEWDNLDMLPLLGLFPPSTAHGD